MARGRPRLLHFHDQRRESPCPGRRNRPPGAPRSLICVNYNSLLYADPERRRSCWRHARRGDAVPFEAGSGGWPHIRGLRQMRKLMIGALCAATMICAVPAAAQDFPVKGGDYWTVSEITIDDGHFGDYADHLA